MKSKQAAPRKNEPEKVAYILPQGDLAQVKRRAAIGKPCRQSAYNSSGYVLIGMYESLGKTFVTHKAAADWAEKHGYKVKLNRKAKP